MPTRARSLLSPLNSKTFRMYPTCRTLAYYRRNLGNGEPRLALRWNDLNGSLHWDRLSQTRFAVTSILISLELPEDIIEEAAYWVVSQASSGVLALGDATNISAIENGKHPISLPMKEVFYLVRQLTSWGPLLTGDQILFFRERLSLSQTRFVALCMIAQMPMHAGLQRRIAKAVIANQYHCPSAGDYGHVSQVECGGKQLTREGMRAFCRTFSYLLNRPVLPEELFDDYLEEIELWNQV